MALKSRLFAGDQRLQAAAQDNAAHVLPGTVGLHVGRIQRALFLLDDALIAPQELRHAQYGQTTARAVLAYKRARSIVNHAYQNVADDIVGVMTMAALDAELCRRELATTKSRGCSDCAGAGGRSAYRGVRFDAAVGAKTAGAPSARIRAFPATLNVVMMWTTGAMQHQGSAASRRWRYFERASELMAIYGQRFGIVASVGEIPTTLSIDPGSRSDAFKVRSAAEKVMPGNADALRIIACPFERTAKPYYALTEGGSVDGATFRDFILLNSNALRDDQCTVLHEMVHAASRRDGAETRLVDRWKHDRDATSIYSEGHMRSQYLAEHAQLISEAYFASRA